MYGISNSYQYICMLKGIGVGFFLGILFLIFKIIRLKFNSYLSVFIQDIIFFVMSSLITFIFMLDMNFGAVRFYILLSEAVGFLLNYFTFGRVINKKT